jgi:hypothetical protein
VWVSNDQPLKRLTSSHFYRRKGEGQKWIQICATMLWCRDVFSHVDVCQEALIRMTVLPTGKGTCGYPTLLGKGKGKGKDIEFYPHVRVWV